MQEPAFFRRHILLNGSPAATSVPSSMVTSSTNSTLSQGIEVAVGLGVGALVGKTRVCVGSEGVLVPAKGSGVVDAIGVGDPSMAI